MNSCTVALDTSTKTTAGSGCVERSVQRLYYMYPSTGGAAVTRFSGTQNHGINRYFLNRSDIIE